MHYVVSATWGPTDPTRAMLPFIFAASAVQAGDTVTLMLFHDAVLMAMEGAGARASSTAKSAEAVFMAVCLCVRCEREGRLHRWRGSSKAACLALHDARGMLRASSIADGSSEMRSKSRIAGPGTPVVAALFFDRMRGQLPPGAP